MIGIRELALRTPLTAQQREYLTMAGSSAEFLLRLLNDILDFSKIEARRLELEQVDFELRIPSATPSNCSHRWPTAKVSG